ncbi:hypothetical protein AWM75_07355 [Aerococcus urinaehominis]|uniref:Serine aminopeptidase S33 domain-containing protein n=1 Tax=Aerococcus urinaehominis TaxID=128944 RepID=A0A120IB18_9LACT|nr:alpha/beta fold hydrolase [Aerococcus urinaehominis]AMB99790.1 hypothetical protein AWM75_07355 [Aerococcus urinaehominis]SDM08907.1 hypothetical protein SAMN04487985_10517 [Aerococcus urinaehominis]
MYTIEEVNFAGIPCLSVHPDQAQANRVIIGYHGWTNTKESVLPQAIAFARQGFQVILPDAYLHGQRRPAGYHYQPQVDLLASLAHNCQEFDQLSQAVLAHYQVDQVAIFGTSMGGMTVSLIIAGYRDRLAAAVQYIAALDLEAQLDQLSQGKLGASIKSDLTPDQAADQAQYWAYIKDHNLARQTNQIAGLPFYIYNGGQDDWVKTAINRQLVPQIKQAIDPDLVDFTIFEDQDHWVPFEIMTASAAYISKFY